MKELEAPLSVCPLQVLIFSLGFQGDCQRGHPTRHLCRRGYYLRWDISLKLLLLPRLLLRCPCVTNSTCRSSSKRCEWADSVGKGPGLPLKYEVVYFADEDRASCFVGWHEAWWVASFTGDGILFGWFTCLCVRHWSVWVVCVLVHLICSWCVYGESPVLQRLKSISPPIWWTRGCAFII